MNEQPIHQSHISSLQKLTQKFLRYCRMIGAIEAMSGVVLLIFTAAAVVWANSAYSDQYFQILHASLAINIGNFELSATPYFIINDILMTIFFLVVGVEVRHEMHNGALANIKTACLPIIAACGGVLVPALIYMLFTFAYPSVQQGWAIPTATDIAFAVGILALLGKKIPASARIFLLSLAIIDDILAVLIVALFYSDGLNFAASSYVIIGLLLIILFQRMGIFSMLPYCLPAAFIWYGLFNVGVHPALTGVVLGLLTPVFSRPNKLSALAQAEAALNHLKHEPNNQQEMQRLKLAQRELRPPVTRVNDCFAPWVAFLIMPLFALVNAGVNIGQIRLDYLGANQVMLGIAVALVLGKPLGIFLITWLSVRLGIGKLAANFNYQWLLLVSCLAGIGFTMSIFIATLAFNHDQVLLDAAKLGVLLGSLIAAVIGIFIGLILKRK